MSNHSFDVAIAVEYKNVDLAILVWHFQYWINMNKRLGRNFHEGRTWTYQTLTEITACFPYWSKRQVEKYINKAVALNILVKGNFNKNAFDRTVWYAFVNEAKFLFPDYLETEDLKDDSSGISPNGEMENTERRNGKHRTVTPIPDTLPDALPDKDNMSELPFGRAALYFYEQLVLINPKIKKPNLSKWAKELSLLATDGKEITTEEDIIKAMDYVLSTHDSPSSNGFRWSNVVMCAQSLRKQFPKIWDEMKAVKKPKTNFEANKKLAQEIAKRCNPKDIVLGDKYLEFICGSYVDYLSFDDKDFRMKALEQLKKRKIKIENL